MECRMEPQNHFVVSANMDPTRYLQGCLVELLQMVFQIVPKLCPNDPHQIQNRVHKHPNHNPHTTSMTPPMPPKEPQRNQMEPQWHRGAVKQKPKRSPGESEGSPGKSKRPRGAKETPRGTPKGAQGRAKVGTFKEFQGAGPPVCGEGVAAGRPKASGYIHICIICAKAA